MSVKFVLKPATNRHLQHGTIFRLGRIAVLGWVFACTNATGPTSTSAPDEAVVATASSTYPNMPAGLTALWQYDGNGLPGGGTLGFKTTNMVLGQAKAFSYVANTMSAPTVSDAPIDPSQVYNTLYPTGLSGGTTPCAFWAWKDGTHTPVNEYYEAGWFKLVGPNFEGPGSSGEWKALGYWAVAGAPGSGQDNDVYQVLGPTGTTTKTAAGIIASQWYFSVRMQNYAAWTLTGGTVLSNKWYRYEIHMVANTVGASNGVLEVWLTDVTDGGSPTKVITSTNRVYRTSSNPAGFWQRTFVPVWGGSAPVGKTRNDNVEVARIAGFGK